MAGRGSSFMMAEADPYHLNDVEELRPEMAAAFPLFKAGDLLVDLRNLQTMVVLDGQTREVKWSMTGPFFGQHDPDFAPNGHIIMFDNRITGEGPTLQTQAKGNLLINANANHTLAVLGIDDLIVVHTPDATLIMPKSKAEELKALHGMVDDRLK